MQELIFRLNNTRLALPFIVLMGLLVASYILICVFAAKERKVLSGVCVVFTVLTVLAMFGMKAYGLDRVPVQHQQPMVILDIESGYDSYEQ